MAVLITTACSPSPPPEPQELRSDTPIVVHPNVSWDVRVTAVGSGLVLHTPVGQEVLRIACVNESNVMTVDVQPFHAVGSEERLSVGFDDEVYAFVADPTADRPDGVGAEAPIELGMLDAFARAEAVALSYGAQTVGPYRTPDPETTRLFLEGCRQALEQ